MAGEYNSSHTGEEIDDAIDAVADKVDKETGKGLSANDFTDLDKSILSANPAALALKADISSLSQATNVLYVDNKRTDTYTEVGTYNYPYKTIMDALNSITGGTSTSRYCIKIATGAPYTENLTINKDYITLEGYGDTILNGNLTFETVAAHVKFRDLKLNGNATGAYTNGFVIDVCDCNTAVGKDWVFSCTVGGGYIQVSGQSTLWYADVDLTNIAGVIANQGGYFEGTHSFTACNGEFIGFENNGGTININAGSEIYIGASMCIETIVNLAEGATLHIDASSASKLATLNNNGGTLDLTTPSSSIDYDNTTSGLTAANVKTAIDELAASSDFILPAISGITLADSNVVFTASDLGITLFEDCSVIKAHDGKYYMFLDNFTGYTNNDIYCVRSDSPLFTSPTFVGKVITRANSRAGSIIYDSVNEEYILYITDRDSPREGIVAYSSAKNDFPNTWTSEGSAIVIEDEDPVIIDAMGNSIMKNGGIYILPYSTSAYLNFAFSNKPKGLFSKFGGNPILRETPFELGFDSLVSSETVQTRAIAQTANGYLCFYEGKDPTMARWQVGAYFLDRSLMFGYEIEGSPLFTSETLSILNVNTAIINNSEKKLYLYYQMSSGENPQDYDTQYVATFNLIP